MSAGAIDIPFQSDLPYSHYSNWSEPLNTNQLIRLYLSSSGLQENNFSKYEKRIYQFLEKSESSIQSSQSDEEKSEALLLYMHNNLFKRYSLKQTRVDKIFDTGYYNCVSSAALFIILNRYHNIFIEGVHAIDHAFCVLPVDGDRDGIDIETTSEWGFDPGSRKEFQSNFTNRTGYVYVPQGNYNHRVRLNDKDMAGLILQNRIVELQGTNQHREALTLAADRLLLTGSTQALEDYFDAVQNAAALLNSKNDYIGAFQIIHKAFTGPYEFPQFLIKTQSQILFNASADLVNKNKLEEARQFLTDYSSFILTEELATIESLIQQRSLELKVREPFSEELIKEIEQSLDDGYITDATARSLASFHYLLEAEDYSNRGEHRKAFDFLMSAPPWVQQDREFKRILTHVRNNTAIVFHNQVVQLINEGRTTEADTLLREALRLLPGHTLLLQDEKKLSN
jgi:tetratricopeptide (TPR) repeat protein